jgi:hypothetical protein
MHQVYYITDDGINKEWLEQNQKSIINNVFQVEWLRKTPKHKYFICGNKESNEMAKQRLEDVGLNNIQVLDYDLSPFSFSLPFPLSLK